MVGDGERKSTLIAEAIEDFARSVSPSSPVIFALIEKRSGLLTVAEIVNEGDTVFFCHDLIRNFAVEDFDALFEALKQAHFRVVAFKDALGGEQFDEDFASEVFDPLGGLAQRLDHEVIAVAIHNQRRQ